jgi:protocatechuate 3,4-dioxygenase beta subunit
MQHRSISRRRFVATGLATAGVLQLGSRGFAFGSITGETCLLNPEQEVGPFYVASEMVRSSIAEGKPGVPLRLRIVVMDQRTCAPLKGAAVDLWHCDAMGLYSGFTASDGFGPPGGGPGGGGPPGFGQGDGSPSGPPPEFDPSRGPGTGRPHAPTDKLTFLRGIQMTGADGAVTYETMFPGFYQGRVNHIHFKVRLEGHRSGKTYAAGHVSHVGQVFFPEEVNLQLMALTPYSSHMIHRTTMDEDHVFNDEHGSLASVHLLDAATPQDGYVAEYRAAVDPAAVPAAVDMRPGRPPKRS